MEAKIGLLNWLGISALGMIWGSSFMATSVAITGFGPLSVAASRISLGAILLVILSYIRGYGLPKFRVLQGTRVWLAALGMGVFSMAVPFFLLSWGQGYVASGFAGVSMAAIPLIILPLAHFLVPGEQLTLRKTVGFVFGFVGVVTLIGFDAFELLGVEMEALARIACLAATTCYAIGSIITRLSPKVDMTSFAAAATLLAALLITPVALLVEGLPEGVNIKSLWAVLYLGVVPTAVANLLLVAVIRTAGPTFMSLTNYQVPLWAVFFGSTLLGEALPSSLLLALALILIGVAISQWGAIVRLLRSRRSP